MDSKNCSWCNNGSILDVSPGIFRDFDSDFFYGIPICGGCGGLGVQIQDETFKENAEIILKLRSEFCPVDGKVEEVRKQEIVIELKELVTKHLEEFGKYAPLKCFARDLIKIENKLI